MSKPSKSEAAWKVELTIDVVARPATVYKFLCDPQYFKRWMGENASLDPHANGSLSVPYPDGSVALGKVVEMVPNSKVVFGWGYKDAKNGIPPDSTRLIIELEELPGGTRIKLRHEGLPSEEQRNEHFAGWSYYLSVLGVAGTHEELGSKATPAIAAYLEAWNHRDPGSRETILLRCWDDAGSYKDRFGNVRGRAALNAYISNAQRASSGAQIELVGSPDLCFEYVAFAWRIRMPNGQIMGSGRSFGQLSIEGKLRSIVGFWDAVVSS